MLRDMHFSISFSLSLTLSVCLSACLSACFILYCHSLYINLMAFNSALCCGESDMEMVRGPSQ